MLWNAPTPEDRGHLMDLAADNTKQPHVRMAALGTLVLPFCIEGHASCYMSKPFQTPANAGRPAIKIEPRNILTPDSPLGGRYFRTVDWFGEPLLRMPVLKLVYILTDEGDDYELATDYSQCETSIAQEPDDYFSDFLDPFVVNVRQYVHDPTTTAATG